ncbi:secreted trypsin-like serine protease [Hamadaea flava]|uniref:S1 family peptidase n=1 Tax=Hamadaea flava TaxID=1742688 RepID=A0ABV8LIV5_9ACTN|nr:serine protease [Hamadaea flava]MCP2325436.1 secreted trypsin-like serine protease [Hamadaea flava]
MRRLTSWILAAALLGLLTPVPAYATADRRHRAEVVGGVLARGEDFPWVVHLSVSCAGALIRPQFVLTAAHCAGATGKNTKIRVTAGSHDLKDPHATVVNSVYVHRAPGFSGVTEGRDWAVIKLRDPLNLPTLRLSGGGDDFGTFTIMGWGTTSENSFAAQRRLRTAKVPLVADATCAAAYAKAGYEFRPDEMICAGDVRRGGVDTCQGDSGGPMVKRAHDGQFVEIGIVSFGVGCARKAYPGVYTEVSHFADAIRKTMDDLDRVP